MTQDAIARKYAARIKRLEAELAAERSLWKSDATVERTLCDPKQMHALEVLDGILNEETKLRAYSGITGKEHARLFELYDEEIGRQGKTLPLEYRESDPGDGGKLYRRHALLLSLAHLHAGAPQPALGAMFCIGQSAVSRYLALNLRVLESILPAAKAISETIARLRGPKAAE